MTNVSEQELAPLSAMAQAIHPGRYEHYKGHVVRVVGVGRDSETLAEVVLYCHEGDNTWWVRSVAMWGEHVEVNGQPRPRFRALDV